MHNDLAPCPFCSGAAVADFIAGASYAIKCGTCQARTWHMPSASAAAAVWNRRAAQGVSTQAAQEAEQAVTVAVTDGLYNAILNLTCDPDKGDAYFDRRGAYIAGHMHARRSAAKLVAAHPYQPAAVSVQAQGQTAGDAGPGQTCRSSVDVLATCDAYESGVGHGMEQDGHIDGDIYANPDCADAYEIGYREGKRRAGERASPNPICERKTGMLESEGYSKTGYVLRQPGTDREVAISDGGAVSWFTLDQWNWLMFNRDHVEFQWPKPISALAARLHQPPAAPAHVDDAAERQLFDAEPASGGTGPATVPPGSAACLTLQSSQGEATTAIADALSAMLWLYRRSPRGYGRQAHIEAPIKRLAQRAGIEVDECLAEREPNPNEKNGVTNERT